MKSLLIKLGYLLILSLGIALTSGNAIAGERCSKVSGRCFEWPLVPHGTTLEKISTSGVWSKPEGDGPFPALIIAESCGGQKPTVTKMWPKYLNSLGIATYTPKVLEKFGKKYCPNMKFIASNPNRIKMLRILYSALDEMRKKDYVDKNSIGIIGFSLGGINIRDAGEIKDLKSPEGNKFKYAVNVYGYCTLLERQGDNIPTLMLLAENDNAGGKMKYCDKAKAENFENMTWHTIAGAWHAFDDPAADGKTDPGKNKMKYSKSATEEAKTVIKDFVMKNK
jgi:dienelactone hydrolase